MLETREAEKQVGLSNNFEFNWEFTFRLVIVDLLEFIRLATDHILQPVIDLQTFAFSILTLFDGERIDFKGRRVLLAMTWLLFHFRFCYFTLLELHVLQIEVGLEVILTVRVLWAPEADLPKRCLGILSKCEKEPEIAVVPRTEGRPCLRIERPHGLLRALRESDLLLDIGTNLRNVLRTLQVHGDLACSWNQNLRLEISYPLILEPFRLLLLFTKLRKGSIVIRAQRVIPNLLRHGSLIKGGATDHLSDLSALVVDLTLIDDADSLRKLAGQVLSDLRASNRTDVLHDLGGLNHTLLP